MAKKQSRRSVSLNRANYEAAKLEADRRGVSLAALVESGLAAMGVPVVAHPQQTADLAQANAARRIESMSGELPATPLTKQSTKQPSKQSAKPSKRLAKAAAKQSAAKPATKPKKPSATKPKSKPKPKNPAPRPSRVRQMLGDHVADAYGFA